MIKVGAPEQGEAVVMTMENGKEMDLSRVSMFEGEVAGAGLV